MINKCRSSIWPLTSRIISPLLAAERALRSHPCALALGLVVVTADGKDVN
jgi:hypothetical protein